MATIVSQRSPLYYEKVPGGMPFIRDALTQSGNIFFADSNAANAGDTAGYGTEMDAPFATIDFAVGQCTANQGDLILALPGHTETVSAAAGLALDVAGIKIVFLGEGNARGSINFGTDVAADMDVDAADITMINPRFVAAIDALTGPIDINAARFKIVGGTCQDGTAINTTDWVVADANADDVDLDLTFVDGDGSGTQKQSFIQVAGATRPKLRHIRATGDFGTGVIENGTAWIDAELDDIIIENTAAGPVVGILLQATSSGAARKVHVRVASGTTYVTADNDMQWFECYGVGTDAAAGDHIGTVASGSIEGKIDTLTTTVGSPVGADISADIAAVKAEVDKIDGLAMDISPVAGSMARYLASGGTALGTELPDSTSLYDVIGPGKAGALKVTIADGTTIPNNTQAAAGLLATATGGDVLIEEIIWQRGATAFTTATNYEFSTDNANGLTGAAAPNVVALSAKFAANVTSIASLDGSPKQLPFVLESTKKLYIHGDDGVTGAGGTTDFYIRYRPLTVAGSLA